MHLFWHRRDLRVRDNRGLARAARDGEVLPVYVVSEAVLRQVGARQRAFLFAGLAALRRAYRDLGSDLLVRAGEPTPTLARVYAEFDADAVYYNRRYRPARRNRERRVDRRLPTEAVTDFVLVEPGALPVESLTRREFYRDWLDLPKPGPVAAPPADALVDPGEETDVPEASADVDLPAAGYEAARERYDAFLADGVETYGETCEVPALAVERPVGAVSRLSPYLATGMIGVREVWADATERFAAADGDARRNVDAFREALSRREYDCHRLSRDPTLVTENGGEFESAIAWRDDPEEVRAWKDGETGYPFVDAGMRQLAAEGYVHHRPRLVAASFLTTHLLVDWRTGARHFAKRLLDYEPATNYANWQRAASTDADADGFRPLDPSAQLAAYDPDADYVRAYVPELRDVPPDAVADWPALDDGERRALAPDYPDPVVDPEAAPERARRAYRTATGER